MTVKQLKEKLEAFSDHTELYIWDEREGYAYPLEDIEEGYKDPTSFGFLSASAYEEEDEFWKERNMVNPYCKYQDCLALYAEWSW